MPRITLKELQGWQEILIEWHKELSAKINRTEKLVSRIVDAQTDTTRVVDKLICDFIALGYLKVVPPKNSKPTSQIRGNCKITQFPTPE